ncbi:MAG: hypothetical protein HYX40_05995 [Sphingobacteriales bacterium]|nr:hypothetical protein [Sphingobacteriales bacterium]
MKQFVNNMRRSIILFFCLAAMADSKSQCGEESYPVITGYYNYAPGSKFGLGIEAGNIGDESNFGYYAGVKANFYPDKNPIKDNRQPGNILVTDFYVKGSWRFIRVPNHLSSYLVFSVHAIDFESDFNSGIRMLFPINSSLAFSIEPGYYFRSQQMEINVNFHKILN